MTSWYASLIILATGQPVMTLGGYQGWDRILTPPQLAAAVADGTVRYFMVSGRPSFGGPSLDPGSVDVNADLKRWVTSTCTAIPASAYQTEAGNASPGELYDCSGR